MAGATSCRPTVMGAERWRRSRAAVGSRLQSTTTVRESKGSVSPSSIRPVSLGRQREASAAGTHRAGPAPGRIGAGRVRRHVQYRNVRLAPDAHNVAAAFRQADVACEATGRDLDAARLRPMHRIDHPRPRPAAPATLCASHATRSRGDRAQHEARTAPARPGPRIALSARPGRPSARRSRGAS